MQFEECVDLWFEEICDQGSDMAHARSTVCVCVFVCVTHTSAHHTQCETVLWSSNQHEPNQIWWSPAERYRSDGVVWAKNSHFLRIQNACLWIWTLRFHTIGFVILVRRVLIRCLFDNYMDTRVCFWVLQVSGVGTQYID